MTVSITIGLRLKAARKAANFHTACSFATHCNMPVSTYAQHETGKRALNAETLLFYSDALSVDAGWLLSGKGKPYSTASGFADRKAIVDQQLFSVENSAQVSPELAPLEAGIALVDVGLLRDVLLRFVALLKDITPTTDNTDLVGFALEIYNGVVMTSATQTDRLAMIDLSVASLRRGIVSLEMAQGIKASA
jgi:transcriptional regulator with XRE-family HTH domain